MSLDTRQPSGHSISFIYRREGSPTRSSPIPIRCSGPDMLLDHPLLAPGTSAQSAGLPERRQAERAAPMAAHSSSPRYVVTFRIHVRGRFMSRTRLGQRIRQKPIDETAGDTLALLEVEVIKMPGIISCARKRSTMCAYNSKLGEPNSHFKDLRL